MLSIIFLHNVSSLHLSFSSSLIVRLLSVIEYEDGSSNSINILAWIYSLCQLHPHYHNTLLHRLPWSQRPLRRRALQLAPEARTIPPLVKSVSLPLTSFTLHGHGSRTCAEAIVIVSSCFTPRQCLSSLFSSLSRILLSSCAIAFIQYMPYPLRQYSFLGGQSN